MDVKFYFCKHCGKIIVVVKDSGVPTVCCGEDMVEMVPGTTDAAVEKHVPVVNVEGNKVTVNVGSVTHPMLPEHYIEWILIKTNKGIQKKLLKPGDEPKAEFALLEGEKVEVQISKFEDQGEKKVEVTSEKIVEVLGEKIETPEKLDALGKLELLGGKAEVPGEKIEAIGYKIKVPGEKLEALEKLELLGGKAEVPDEKIIEVIDDKIKVPGEKIEVLGGKLETLEKLELPGEKLVNAEGRLQAIGPTVEKPQPSNVERLASNLERPAPNIERPVSNIERPASNIKLQASNVERSSDLAESPKTDGVVIPVAAPFAQDAPVVQAAPATIEIDPSAATARTSELTEAASAVAKTISVTPALSRGDGEVVIRLKPTVLDGSEIRIEAKGSAITIDISPASAEAAQIVERSQAQFAQQLAERMPSFQFTVATTTRQSYDRKATSNETT